MSIIKSSINGLIVAGLIFSLSGHNRAYAKDLEITGFVDGSFSTNDNAETSTFGLDKVVVYTSKELGDKASIYTDLAFNAGMSGLNVDKTKNVDPKKLNKQLEMADKATLNVDQAYLKLSGPFGAGIDFTFGKFDAPIGFELVDAPDMFQFSHSLVFDYGIALFHTGLMVDKSFGMIDTKIYVVNGWDNNTDNNESKTVGGRLGVNMNGLNVGVSGVTGPEKTNNNSDNRRLLDIDLTYTGVDKLTIGGEFNSGTEDQVTLDDSWTAFLIMAHYDFLDNLGLTLRFDQFDDTETGNRLGAKTTRRSFTAAATFVLAEHLGGIVEFRQDSADDDVFEEKNGNLIDTSNTVAIEFTGTF